MGYAKATAVVANSLDRSKKKEIELLVDTGAIYSMLPSSILRGLGISPTGKRRFKLASGESKSFETGEAYIAIDGVGATSITIFGSEDSTPLLGVTALENLGLKVDPMNGKLEPAELLLLRIE